ncbi:hypothetical protein [Nocardioides sp. ChNu-99]|uniref:hypothetical protein n=1 Tax=Nocardioides sp. ChNu-99 TaxID=2839897 RepID=UPI002406060D|nr:hypothetical protein [Nocardioides sp. ChNu-99]MDF9714830.1 hypothetical protein [Nocardioides sp. ChNu-99]
MFDDLVPAELLAAASAAVRDRRLAEVRDLELLAAWAALHSGESARRGNPLVPVGGEGTPRVQDHALGEIALARGTGVTATVNALADVLDLQHRLPRTWAVLRTGTAEVYVARRVARMSRHLPLDRVGVVDAAIARMIATEAGGRVIAVAEAKVVEADPDLHEARAEEERRRRYVGLGRSDEHGLRTLIARIDAGDAAWVDATVTRTAEILAPQHPDAGADELRAVALGYLARPAELLQLLVESEAKAETRAEAGDADTQARDEPSRATAFPADLLDALRTTDWSALRPRSTLYVHLHEAVLLGETGVTRVEQLGPRTLTALQGLLAGAEVTVRPVIDLADRVRTTAYEHPESLRERVHLVTGGDYWPYATSTSRAVDLDHPTPYDDTGPPGRAQTGTHNSGPLGRRHHRWKTHAGYRSRQTGPGRYVWSTPHGLGFLVDHAGTHVVSSAEARLMIAVPRTVDADLC